MSPRIQTFIKVLGVALVIIISSEFLLRVTGMILIPSEKEYQDLSGDAEKIRILVLGESTTDDRFANGHSWSSQLEKRLTNKGHKVRIYNVGRVGSNTAILLSRLPDQLDTYRPHLVISMMGINDSSEMYYNFEEQPLKLIKLLRIVRERLESRLSCEVDVRSLPANVNKDDFKRWMKFSGKQNLNELEADIRKKFPLNEDVASLLGILGKTVRNFTQPHDPEKYLYLHERAFQIQPRNDLNLRAYLNALNGRKNPACMKIIGEIIPCAVNLNDEYLKHISVCHKNTGKPLTEDILKIRGISFIAGKGTVPYHYEKMVELLRKKKIQLAAMQYPTLPLEELRNNFINKDGVVFISNEENFSKALQTYGYFEIFKDKFRATWGHTTTLGHSLIADSVMKEIEPLVIRLRSEDKP